MTNKPITATEIENRAVEMVKCTCGECEYCHVRKSIVSRQEAMLNPLIERTKQLLQGKG